MEILEEVLRKKKKKRKLTSLEGSCDDWLQFSSERAKRGS